ncbi:MAG: cupin domain-containing protein [bacterium]
MNSNIGHLAKMDVTELTENIYDDWKNFIISEVNDHVVRLSVLQRDFHWHIHKNSDECFYVIEGSLFVDLEDHTEVINPRQMITIPKNIRHRTRSNVRTLILCFESKDSDVTGN